MAPPFALGLPSALCAAFGDGGFMACLGTQALSTVAQHVAECGTSWRRIQDASAGVSYGLVLASVPPLDPHSLGCQPPLCSALDAPSFIPPKSRPLELAQFGIFVCGLSTCSPLWFGVLPRPLRSFPRWLEGSSWSVSAASRVQCSCLCVPALGPPVVVSPPLAQNPPQPELRQIAAGCGRTDRKAGDPSPRYSAACVASGVRRPSPLALPSSLRRTQTKTAPSGAGVFQRPTPGNTYTQNRVTEPATDSMCLHLAVP